MSFPDNAFWRGPQSINRELVMIQVNLSQLSSNRDVTRPSEADSEFRQKKAPLLAFGEWGKRRRSSLVAAPCTDFGQHIVFRSNFAVIWPAA